MLQVHMQSGILYCADGYLCHCEYMTMKKHRYTLALPLTVGRACGCA